MKSDKLYETLLNCYREIYRSLGVDFDKIDKQEGFYLNYEIDGVVEDKIVNEFINSQRLTRHQKQVIKSSYYLGCAPVSKVEI